MCVLGQFLGILVQQVCEDVFVNDQLFVDGVVCIVINGGLDCYEVGQLYYYDEDDEQCDDFVFQMVKMYFGFDFCCLDWCDVVVLEWYCFDVEFDDGLVVFLYFQWLFDGGLVWFYGEILGFECVVVIGDVFQFYYVVMFVYVEMWCVDYLYISYYFIVDVVI